LHFHLSLPDIITSLLITPCSGTANSRTNLPRSESPPLRFPPLSP
jgi:hypothetical protein